MRNKERIEKIMNFFEGNKEALSKFTNIENVDYLIKHWPAIEQEWEENPDYRMGQLLINMELIPDGKAWFEEENDWLIEEGYFKFEELHWWGQSYDRDMNRIPTRMVLLSELTTDHIRGIIKYFKNSERNLNERYLEYFNKRIENENNP